MFKGLTSIMYKETFHILRDFRTLFLMLLLPVMDLAIFGYAIDLEVRNIATVVYNLDGRQQSRELLDMFVNSGYFSFEDVVLTDAELERAIVRGEAKVGIKIPPDYSDRLLRGESAQVQVLLDGSDSTVAMQALQVINAIALRKSIDIISESAGLPGAFPIDARPRVLFNPDMKTPYFMVPGLVGMIMQSVTMLLTAFAVVREKETGTLEQLMVTPVSRLGLMLGKLLPYAVVGFIEMVFALALMRVLFRVPIAGNVVLLGMFGMVFVLTTLGMGLLISTMAQNHMQAVQLALLLMLPSILMSGFMFPIESMPKPLYAVAHLIPATYWIRILRGVILRSAGFADLWDQGVWMVVIGVVVLAVAASRFRKTLA
ncbi:MAG TPA: ABC transporter permease [Candidatus Hydrogenedentes bacterium]|jgi:ABC transporter DrrB family efflux protein|nr:ABC transporter permease [Candidatus Hydrogenedentota bacterium]